MLTLAQQLMSTVLVVSLPQSLNAVPYSVTSAASRHLFAKVPVGVGVAHLQHTSARHKQQSCMRLSLSEPRLLPVRGQLIILAEIILLRQ